VIPFQKSPDAEFKSSCAPGVGPAFEIVWTGESGVWTLSTLWPSDWALMVPDWLRLLTFWGLLSVCRGRNAVRVHLGHVFSLFRGFLDSDCGQFVLWGPLRGPFFIGGRCCGPVPPLFSGRWFWCLLPVHGRDSLGQHDLRKFLVGFLFLAVGHRLLLLGSRWLFCLFMVGPGECDMTCSQLFENGLDRDSRHCSDTGYVPDLDRYRRTFGPSNSHRLSSCTLCFGDRTCSWLRSASTA
jgi:hypothetical protein